MKNFTLGIVLIMAVIAFIAIWFGVAVGRASQAGAAGYSVVYLANGDIYFGKLRWSMHPKLTDAWYAQRSVDASGQTQISILPWRGVSWDPKDEIYFNQKQILFWSRLDPNGEFAKLLANPAFRNQQFNDSQIPTGGVIPSSP